MDSIDDEWNQFIQQSHSQTNTLLQKTNKSINISDVSIAPSNIPKCQDLNISTKTKVLFLNQPLDIHKVFWNIPIIEYWKPTTGVLKKQMKVVCNSKEEYEAYCEKIKDIPFYVEHVIKEIDNQSARRIKYKNERKIKDLIFMLSPGFKITHTHFCIFLLLQYLKIDFINFRFTILIIT